MGVGAPAPEQEPGEQLPTLRLWRHQKEKGFFLDHTELGEDPGPELRLWETKGLERSFSQCLHFTGGKTEKRREETCQIAKAESPMAPGSPECNPRRDPSTRGAALLSQFQDGAGRLREAGPAQVAALLLACCSSAVSFPITGTPNLSYMRGKERGEVFPMQNRPEAHERKKSTLSEGVLRARHCNLCHHISS